MQAYVPNTTSYTGGSNIARNDPPSPSPDTEKGGAKGDNSSTSSDKKGLLGGWKPRMPALPSSTPHSSSPRRDLSPQEVRIRWIACGVFSFLCVAVGLGVLISSLKKVDTNEYGVQYNVYKKTLDDAAESGGLFLGPPGYTFIKFPSTYVTVNLDKRTCVSQDGLLVGFSVTFQYRMIEINMLPTIEKYRDFESWAPIVEQAGLSAIHHSCADYQISDFQQKRGIIQGTMEENLKLKLEGDPENDLEGVYAVAVSLQLRELVLPAEYNTAVAEKQSAEEDIALAQNQRKQETTKAQTELLKATEEARKILDTARNDADVMLTEARLKAEETVFEFSKEAETIVEVKEALNLTTEGVLAYLANNLLKDVEHLKITTGEPAKLSRRDEL